MLKLADQLLTILEKHIKTNKIKRSHAYANGCPRRAWYKYKENPAGLTLEQIEQITSSIGLNLFLEEAKWDSKSLSSQCVSKDLPMGANTQVLPTTSRAALKSTL